MKALLKLIFTAILLLTIHQSFAQAPEQDCIHAIRICSTPIVHPGAYNGSGTVSGELTTANEGCLYAGEINDVWYLITFKSSGLFGMTINPVDPFADYDFAVWDITNTNCTALFNYTTNQANNFLPVACNASGITGGTGLSNSSVGSAFIPSLPVTQGQTLLINISNFANVNTGYTLDFSESTAGFVDTVHPRFVSATTPVCYNAGKEIDLVFSEQVTCDDIALNGQQFYISNATASVISAAGVNCSGSPSMTDQIRLTMNTALAPGTYWVHLSSTINRIRDICGNKQPLTDSISLTVPDNLPKVSFVVTGACLIAIAHFNHSVACNTIALNGSDFYITGPGNVTVAHVTPLNCTPAGLTDSVAIRFTNPIGTNGIYRIDVHQGSDLNGVLDTCGRGIGPAGGAAFAVACNHTGITSTTLEPAAITLYPNPVHSDLTLTTTNPGVLTIYTLQGVKLMTYPIAAQRTIVKMPESITPGLYLGRYETKNGAVSQVRIICE